MSGTAIDQLAAQIDALLPQTQCTRCGYAGCEPYAQAIATGEADFNQCPPGGQAGIVALAALLGRAPKPLNPRHGEEQPHRIACVDETRCIGCTLCIQACPVDAIVGAPKQMHTVVAALCSGCELCVAPCPVDCITMTAPPAEHAVWDRAAAQAARQRFERRRTRLARDKAERANRLAQRAPVRADKSSQDAKQAMIQAALARARARRAQFKQDDSTT